MVGIGETGGQIYGRQVKLEVRYMVGIGQTGGRYMVGIGQTGGQINGRKVKLEVRYTGFMLALRLFGR